MITFIRDWHGYSTGSSISTLADTIEARAVSEGAAVYGGTSFPPNSYLDADNRTQALVDGGGNSYPLSYLLGKQNTAQSKSDLDALESAALFTLDIPANTLGPNSILRIRSLWTVPSSGATKRIRGRFGGTVLWNLDLTTHVSYPLEFILANRNSLASQIAPGNNLSWAVALSSTPVQTFTVDFATAQQFTITAQWPVAGAGSNNITLESVMVEHLYGR